VIRRIQPAAIHSLTKASAKGHAATAQSHAASPLVMAASNAGGVTKASSRHRPPPGGSRRLHPPALMRSVAMPAPPERGRVTRISEMFKERLHNDVAHAPQRFTILQFAACRSARSACPSLEVPASRSQPRGPSLEVPASRS
jgi:hypothetical protein